MREKLKQKQKDEGQIEKMMRKKNVVLKEKLGKMKKNIYKLLKVKEKLLNDVRKKKSLVRLMN